MHMQNAGGACQEGDLGAKIGTRVAAGLIA
jgi:hypothetical protein